MAAPKPAVTGLVRVVYRAGAVVATAARHLVVGTVRAAESMAGDSVRSARKPLHTAVPDNVSKKVRRRATS